MKKITAVLWHTSARRLKTIIPRLDGEIELSVYSARSLSDGTESFDALCSDLDDSDFFLFNVTSSDSVWPQILGYVKGNETPIAYVGSEALQNITDEATLRLSATCNEYYNYSG